MATNKQSSVSIANKTNRELAADLEAIANKTEDKLHAFVINFAAAVLKSAPEPETKHENDR